MLAWEPLNEVVAAVLTFVVVILAPLPALEFVVSGTGTRGMALDSAASSEPVVVVAA